MEKTRSWRSIWAVMRKTVFALAVASLAAVGGAAATLWLYNRPVTLRVAAPRSADDLRILSAAAQIFKQHETLRLDILPAADGAAAAAALESHSADLAVLRADAALPANAQALLILHRNAAMLLAPGGGKLRKVSDLRGKRIGVLHEAPGVERNIRLLEIILAQYDLPAKAVTIVPLAPQDLRPALAARKIDALFAFGPPQSGFIADAVAAMSGATGKAPTFLPITEAKAIAKRFPALEPTEILQGAFGGDPPRPEAAVETSGVTVMLAARSDLKDSLAGEVTRLFFTYRAAIAQAAPLASAMEAPSTDKGAVVPAHQGAADYIDGNERSFFEKYSDYMYIGAMLASLVGSGAAALSGRLSGADHEKTERLTERILEILQSARDCTAFAELDAYEREIDDCLVATLADHRLHAGGAGLHVVTLAVDQARRAIKERRRVLASEGTVVAFAPPRHPPSAQ